MKVGSYACVSHASQPYYHSLLLLLFLPDNASSFKAQLDLLCVAQMVLIQLAAGILIQPALLLYGIRTTSCQLPHYLLPNQITFNLCSKLV